METKNREPELTLWQRYEPVIGLEVHCQLNTASKLFCGCSTAFGALPNHQVCPVCLGHPGVLPQLNRKAVDSAIRLALALKGEVQELSVFARKQYFYPDLPKSYQLTQYDKPYCLGGRIELSKGRSVRLNRIHIEEDAGKCVHAGAFSFVDYNRAGTPLLEIVSEADLRSPSEAAEYLKKLRAIVRSLGISDGNLEEGSFRCDANVSLRPRGQKAFGTRCEIKNLNSFRNIEKAISYEILRQADLLDAREAVEQSTLLWDAAAGVTRVMRKKGNGEDYRYFSDPDLPPLVITQERLSEQRAQLKELPEEKAQRFCQTYGLSPDEAVLLTEDGAFALLFERSVELSKGSLSGKQIASWLGTEYLRAANELNWDLAQPPLGAEALSELFSLLGQKVISGKIAKKVFAQMARTGKGAKELVEAEGLVQILDTEAMDVEIAAVLQEHPALVVEYLEGKEKVFGFFVGQLMQRSKGRFNPEVLQGQLRRALNAS